MAASPSFERAQRLPRDFAWITVAIAAAQFIVNMTVLLLPTSPHSEQMRSVYAQPGVWIPLFSRVAAVWLLAATLAWCHARKALDERGAARIARLRSPGSRFAAVYLAATVVNVLALTPLFYKAQVLFMPGGPLHEYVDVYGLRSIMATSRMVQSVLQMLVLIASVWLAAWWALRERGAAIEEESSGVGGAGGAGARYASVVAARVLDHLAVVRQAARRHQFDGAAQLGHFAHRIGNARVESGGRASAFEPEGHLVVAHLAADTRARLAGSPESGARCRPPGRVHEHAAHLGGLVGAAQPALDALVGAAGGAGAREHGREVAGAEADQRVVGVEAWSRRSRPPRRRAPGRRCRGARSRPARLRRSPGLRARWFRRR
jgi:hypothetical protein